jgi:hypothetical protein
MPVLIRRDVQDGFEQGGGDADVTLITEKLGEDVVPQGGINSLLHNNASTIYMASACTLLLCFGKNRKKITIFHNISLVYESDSGTRIKSRLKVAMLLLIFKALQLIQPLVLGLLFKESKYRACRKTDKTLFYQFKHS